MSNQTAKNFKLGKIRPCTDKSKPRPVVHKSHDAYRILCDSAVMADCFMCGLFNYNRSASAAAHSAWERLRPLAADSVATIPEPETIKENLSFRFCGVNWWLLKLLHPIVLVIASVLCRVLQPDELYHDEQPIIKDVKEEDEHADEDVDSDDDEDDKDGDITTEHRESWCQTLGAKLQKWCHVSKMEFGTRIQLP
ncbi:hypothetical protein Tco_1547176 [Tanacetum coccineum]